MANNITSAERAAIQRTADQIVKLDRDQMVSNYDQAVNALIQTYGISKQRARQHIAKAARIKRGRRR